MALGKKTGGRQKGTPNKLTGDVKAMVVEALDQAGGIEYLLTQAHENPKAFLTLVGRVIPLQVAGDPENPIKHTVEHTITDYAALRAALNGKKAG